MQMPRSTVAVEMLKEAGLPYVVVLTNPTTGGVTASYAMLGDIQIAEPGALICFAGPRVIEQTIRETLPEGFQRAEYLLDHGMLDRVVQRKDMRDELATILRMLTGNSPYVRGDLPAPPRKPPGRTDGGAMTAAGAPGSDRGPRPADAPAPQGHRPDARPHRAPARRPRPPRARAAAGDPRRRHQRQGLGRRDAPRRPRGDGRPRPCLYLAPPRPLPRAHPHRRRAHRRGPADRRARALRGGERRRADHLLRDHHRRGLPRHGRDPGRLRRSSRSASAAGSTRPTSSSGRGSRSSPRCRSTTSSTSARPWPQIAGEKAGILKPGVPAVVGEQEPDGLAVIEARAEAVGAPLAVANRDWQVWEEHGRLAFLDETGLLDLPPPVLIGRHQVHNAGIALAALRRLGQDEAACAAAVTGAEWPARLQRLRHGPLRRGRRAARSSGSTAATTRPRAPPSPRPSTRLPPRPLHLVTGMLRTKDIAGYLAPARPARPLAPRGDDPRRDGDAHRGGNRRGRPRRRHPRGTRGECRGRRRGRRRRGPGGARPHLRLALPRGSGPPRQRVAAGSGGRLQAPPARGPARRAWCGGVGMV